VPKNPASSAYRIASLLNPPEQMQQISTESDQAEVDPQGITTQLPTPAEAMGLKTGKAEFFIAREENKAAVAKNYPSPPSQPTSQGVTDTQKPASFAPSHRAIEGDTDEADIAPPMPATGNRPDILTSSKLLEEGEKFLISPLVEGDMEIENPHDEEDGDAMLSAASYYQYKLSSSKRKADDISSSTAAEESAMCASVVSPVEQMGQINPSKSAITEIPPAKRQATVKSRARGSNSTVWAVAEKLGFVALGGAVVLGSLIYTAPTF